MSYKVKFLLCIRGAPGDASVYLYRETKLPFVPQVGMIFQEDLGGEQEWEVEANGVSYDLSDNSFTVYPKPDGIIRDKAIRDGKSGLDLQQELDEVLEIYLDMGWIKR